VISTVGAVVSIISISSWGAKNERVKTIPKTLNIVIDKIENKMTFFVILIIFILNRNLDF
jgi:hypothetical protein